nr:hypothetical protein [Tanacetum cinerariifolium]
MEPEENDGDDEKSEGDSIDYPTSRGDNDANDDDDDLSEDDVDDEDEEESSDSEEEEEKHLAPTVPAPALYSFISEFDETEPFEEGETAATPPPFGYRVAARISVQPHILMPFRSESEVERLLAIPTPPLSPVSPTPYPLPPSDDVLPAEEQPLPAIVSPTAESPGYIMDSEPEMDPEEEEGDDEKFERDFIDYPTSRGDDDADDDGDELSKDDADDEDEEEISVRPHIPMPFRSELKVERLLAIPTPSLSPVSPTSYPLPLFLMPLPIFTPLPTPPIILPRTRASMVLMRSAAPSTFILAPRSRTPPIGTPPLLPIQLPTTSFPLPLLLSSTSGSESIPEADMPLRKRTRFTTPTGGCEVGESSVVAAARQIRPALTVADSCRAKDRLIGKLRRERRYFRTLSTTYAWEVAHSRDYCTQIMDYCQSREIHTNTLVTQIEALQKDVSTLQGQHIDDEDRLTRHIQHEHAQRDAASKDGDSCS